MVQGDGMYRIIVCGVGGAGNNTINRLESLGFNGGRLIAMNTDNIVLTSVNARKCILFGKHLTNGYGTGGDSSLGVKCARDSQAVIRNAFRGAELLFLIGGMGGGTGTGAMPEIAAIAKKMGLVVVAIVTSPFKVELEERRKKAERGIRDLSSVVDSLIVVDNDKLMEIAGSLPLKQAFAVVDDFIAGAMKSVVETIHQPSLINIDYADLKTTFATGGLSTIVYGEGSADYPEDVVENAFNHPLLDVNIANSNAVLVHITGGEKFTLKCTEKLMKSINKRVHKKAHIIMGAKSDETLDDDLKLMIIMTGIKNGKKNKSPAMSLVKRLAQNIEGPKVKAADQKYRINWVP